MSSRDVRDILGIAPTASTSSVPSLKPLSSSTNPINKKTKQNRKGISRELYALIGDNAPSLALATSVQPKFAKKIKRVGPAVKWEWTPFTNPSRGDPTTSGTATSTATARSKLQLSHWVRDLPANHVAGTPDTKFLKFNTTSSLFSYSTEEFHQLLREDDWSKEETDYLFALAEEFDVRFIVMADRWDFPSERSVDDLKSRYYSVCRKLIRHRPAASDADRTATLHAYQYEQAREIERKNYLRSLLSRTPAQIAEEDFLFIESRRIEQSYHRLTREREDLLKILGGREGIGAAPGGPQLGVGGGEKGRLAQLQQQQHASGSGEKKKRNSTGYEFEGLNGGGLPDGWAGEGGQRKSTPQQDIDNCIERHPFPSVSAPKAHSYPSTSLRSGRIIPPKSHLATRVAAVLTELGLSSQLIMPTRANVEKLNLLQSELASMLEMKKAIDRIENEIKMVRARKETALGGGRSGSVKLMEEEGAVVNAGGSGKQTSRAGSVKASQAKRSASVASADTEKNKRARRE